MVMPEVAVVLELRLGEGCAEVLTSVVGGLCVCGGSLQAEVEATEEFNPFLFIKQLPPYEHVSAATLLLP